MTYTKYDGTTLLASAPPVAGFFGIDSAETLTGTNAHEQFWGAGGDTLIGKGGDDTYYVQARDAKVVELAGDGIDTVYAWQNINLTRFANIEHAIVAADNAYAAGDAGDNIIEGRDGSQQLYGGLGQDVLIGGTGADTFIVYKGEGNDVLWDFSSQDVIRLKAGFTNFASVKAAMSQIGSDVKIDFGGADGLLVRNWTIDQFTPANFQLELDRTALGKLTFAEEFTTQFRMWDAVHAAGGVWNMSYDSSGSNFAGSYTLASNNEKQIYTSPYFRDHAGTFEESPFVHNGDGTLSIWARPSTNPDIFGYDYTSGLISTRHKAVDNWEPQASGFSQQYGYFEIRADAPEAPGTWPAFWLLPKTFAWPPEIDVFEILGDDTNVVWTTAHSNATGSHESKGQANFVPGDGFHLYGTMWTPTELIWYVDGVEVFRTKTPTDMHQEMSLLANMALGGWAGAVNDGSLPAEFKIDYIRVHALPDGASPPAPPAPGPATPPAPAQLLMLPESAAPTTMINGNGKANLLQGTSGADRLDGQRGADTLTGGAGDDTYIVDNAGDLVREIANGGVDTVRSVASSFRLVANVENLTLNGSSAQTGYGNELNNIMRANTAGSTLDGAGGSDILIAGAGVDVLIGGGGQDIFRFDTVGKAGDRVVDFKDGEDVIDLRSLFSGYNGADPIADGFVKLQDSSNGAVIYYDADGSAGPGVAVALVTLSGVSASNLTMQSDWVFI